MFAADVESRLRRLETEYLGNGRDLARGSRRADDAPTPAPPFEIEGQAHDEPDDQEVQDSEALVRCAGCTFETEPWHDLFLTLESSGAAWLYLFHNMEGESGPPAFSDVAGFIRVHNWKDPSLLEHVSQMLILAEQKGARWPMGSGTPE